MSRVQLSPNFYLDEFLRSETAARHGIRVAVEKTSPAFKRLKRLAETILQPVRDANGPAYIVSGYRPPELNQLVGGSPTSQHCHGEAADFVVSGLTPLEVCQYIAAVGLPYDQLIHEFGQWVHVSIAWGRPPRGQQLTAYRVNGATRYLSGLHPIPQGVA